jgi:hypothetical protein|tara:strand:- start:650 stop:1006 length:357 start_codon:yes stop_codon:yes gene_type:complete
MGGKVIKVDYRKQSESYPDWMKYEITLLNKDGSEETIPAYGKDLQHALSRVVKSRKVQRIKNIPSKIPQEVWILLLFSYIAFISSKIIETSNPLWAALGLPIAILIILGVKIYLTRKK